MDAITITKIPPAYWFAKARYVVLRTTLPDGRRMFPLFTAEHKAYEYQSKALKGGTIEQLPAEDAPAAAAGWVLWTTNYAEYIFDVLDRLQDGFDIYVIDPPPEIGAPAGWWFTDLEDLKAKITDMATAGTSSQN